MSQSTRTLVLVRHAKTEPRNAAGDHARRLREDGLAQAEALGRRLARAVPRVDVAICSDAARAEQTLEQILASYPDAEHWDDARLYDAGPDEVVEIIRENATGDVLMIVGHEPTISGTVALLAEDDASQDLVWGGVPTATALVATIDGAWSDVRPGTVRGWNRIHVSADTV